MKFWRKKKQNIVFSTIPISILIRQVIYDSMLTPAEGIANKLGLPPISDEVADKEEEASQERLSYISSLLPFIDSHANIVGNIAVAAYMLEAKNVLAVGTEDLEQLHSLFKIVSLASALSCVSTLMHLNVIYSNEGVFENE